MGQAAVGGVRTIGMVVKSVAGQDVSQWDFEDIMDLLNDQGIMDPDSKSAASWGDATKYIQRQPVEEVVVPATIEFAMPSAGAGASEAPLCLNGVPRRDGVVGLALPEPLAPALRLSAVKMGPSLEVAKAGPNPEGGFVVEVIRVQGKDMPAASALKMAAKAAGLNSMKGLCVGLRRPSSGVEDAAAWAVFPLAGVSKTGGVVFRSKGPAAEGLGPDDALREVQFFAPGPGDAVLVEEPGCRIFGQNGSTDPSHIGDPDGGGAGSFGLGGTRGDRQRGRGDGDPPPGCCRGSSMKQGYSQLVRCVTMVNQLI
ncbi:unnamed protein product [Effrenium voratum]|nr:unnamed protein product [Effrenium voratum]